MKNRVLGIISFVFNLAVVALVTVGVVSFFYPIYPTKIENPFFQFQVLAGFFAGLMSLIALIVYVRVIAKNKPAVPTAFQVFKLMSNVSLGIVLIASFVYILPTKGDIKEVFSDANSIFRILIPIVSIVSYGFFEIHNKMKWRYTLLGILPTVAYVVFYFVWFFIKKDSGTTVDWYEFGLIEKNWTKVVLSTLIVVGVSYGLSFVLWLLNKLCHLIVYGYEYHDEDIPETPMYSADLIEAQEEAEERATQQEVAPAVTFAAVDDIGSDEEAVEEKPEEVETTKSDEAKPEETKTQAKKTRKAVSATYGKYDGKARVYHISRSKIIGGQWQVKLATGEKAIKLFPTQKEAIEYAKKLVRTQGGSIRIHSMKGQMRK